MVDLYSCSKIKPRTCFLKRRGSNILEPRLQYIGAGALIHWSPSNLFFQNRLIRLRYFFAITQMRFNKTQSIWLEVDSAQKKVFDSWKKRFYGLQYIGAWAPLYWSLGANILEPLYFKNRFLVLFSNMNHGKPKVPSPFVRPSCDTQNLVLPELFLFIPFQNIEN